MLGTHTGGAAVASLAVSWCASAALSAPIVFDNTGGQFQWPTIDRTPGPPLPAQVVVLDVTKPASAQGPLPTQPGPPASLPPGAFAYEINFPPEIGRASCRERVCLVV